MNPIKNIFAICDLEKNYLGMEIFHSHFSKSQKQGFGNFPFSV